MELKIGNKSIGDKHPCFIIAEAGVNHNGDIVQAKKLIDIAKEAGADCVKFQTWITEEIVTKTVEQADYQAENTGINESQYEMLKKLELSFNDFRKLKDYADKAEIIFMSTPDDEKSVDFLDELGVPAFKIGSGELTNQLMLNKIAQKGKPIILSTGMANLNEIEEAIEIIKNTGNDAIILLHCTSQYPTNYGDVNLKAMITIKNKFNTIVGYSDHTIGVIVPQIAVALGADVIEKHFTYDKNAKGPDHKCSLNPPELKQMVEVVRITEETLGDGRKLPTDNEKKVRSIIRKTIVAKERIPKGSKIAGDMLTVKRSNGSLNPNEINNIIGKITKNNIEKDQSISYEDLEY